MLLNLAFKPEIKILDTSVRKLKVHVAHKGKFSGSEMIAIGIFVLTFLGWVFLNEKIGMGIIAISGAFLYMAAGLVDWNTISKNTNWGVILLFSAAISLGIQMKNTGTAQWIGESFIYTFQGLLEQFEFLPYLTTILLTTLLSNVISSSATVAVLGPIMMNLGGHPLMMGMATAISSAFGYFSAVAAPACMIIYTTGLVRLADFLKAGWRVGVMSVFVLMLIIEFYWPWLMKIMGY